MSESSGEYNGSVLEQHENVKIEADRILHYFITGYFFLCFGFGFFYNNWAIGVGTGTILYGIYQLLRFTLKGKRILRVIISVLMWAFPLVFFFEMEGMYEMYFFYFVSFTVMLFYEDWKLLTPIIGLTLLTFVIVYLLQQNSSTIAASLSELGMLSGRNLTVQVSVVSLYAGICILWAILQKNQTRDSAITQVRLERQLKLMDVNIEFANNISQGELNVKYNSDETDRLGESLKEMRNSLVASREREEKEKFLNVGLALIGDILRDHVNDLDLLCDKVIEKLVSYIKANQGGIFILEDEENEEPYLEMKACRAYDRKKFLKQRIDIGEGLVGQSFQEKETIFIKQIPKDYMQITSGLGLATPNFLMIVPLKTNDKIVGCIELATFGEFSQTDREFLEKVGESIASTIISAKTNAQTKLLLEQSRQMTEEMQAQEEEMRQNMEEMQATQEEMARTQKDLGEKEANLNALINNTSDSIITIDRDYTILIMNDVVKNRYKGTQYEGMAEGSNALDMLGDVKDVWKAYYDRAFAGEELNFIIESSVKGENSWREYFINPIRNSSQDIIGASVFSRDITARKKLEQEAVLKGQVLDTMVNNTDNTYFAMDSNYKILYANEVLKKRFEASGISLGEGQSILDVLSGDALKMWKERYDRTLAGESLEFKEDRPVGDKVLKIVTECFPIKDDEGNTVGAAVISKDITAEEEARQEVIKLSEELARLKSK